METRTLKHDFCERELKLEDEVADKKYKPFESW